MPSDDDRSLGELAVERGHVTPAQLAECIENQKAIAGMGIEQSVGQIMASKGYITTAVLEELTRELRRRSGAGNFVGPYELLEKLGEGGMGAVYRARVRGTGATVAVKILTPRLAADKDFVDRFHREAELAARLDHPNIVTAIEASESDGRHYFAMEFVEGVSVQARLDSAGAFPEGQALRMARAVAMALQRAESLGLIHRDIKPDNIFLAPGGEVKLGDMGLAKSIDNDVTRLTQSGMVLGTPQYISPEQVEGVRELDIRCDIYSLGATLYHMVTGRAPFEGPSALAVLNMHLTAEIPWPADLNDDLTDDVCYLIQKMMAKDRDDRYGGPLELIQDIDAVLRGQAPDSEELPVGKSAVRKAVTARDAAAAAERRRRRIEADARRGTRRAASIARVKAARPQQTSRAFVGIGGGIGAVMLIASVVLFLGQGPSEELGRVGVKDPKPPAKPPAIAPRAGPAKRPAPERRTVPAPLARPPKPPENSMAAIREEGAAAMLAHIRTRWESGELDRVGAHRELDAFFKSYSGTKAAADAEKLKALVPKLDPGAGKWYVVSGFPNAGKAGFAAVYAPETGTDVSVVYELPAGAKAGWKLVHAPEAVCALHPVDRKGYIVFYAFANLRSATDQTVTLVTNSDDGIRAWLNGESVVSENVYRGITTTPDTRTKVHLKKGLNPVLVKVTQSTGDAMLKLAVEDNDAEVYRTTEGSARIAAVSSGPAVAFATDAPAAPTPAPAPPARPESEKFLDEFDRAVLSGDYTKASEVIASASKAKLPGPCAAKMAAAKKVLAELVKAGKLAGGYGEAVGKEIEVRLGGILQRCTITAVRPDGFEVEREVRMGRRRTTMSARVRFEDLGPDLLGELRSEYRPGDPDGHVAEAMLALARKDPDSAKKSLAAAGKHPLVPRYEPRLRPPAPPPAAPRHLAGLVSYWSFDGGDARDDLGPHHGTVQGASAAPGMVGRGLVFDGRDDWVEMPDFDIDDSFTLVLWVSPATTDDGQCFVGKHTADGNNTVLIGFWQGGCAVNLREVMVTGTPKTIGWQHLAMVGKKLDAGRTEVTLYRNGTVLATAAVGKAVGDARGKGWVFGQDWDKGTKTDFFGGVLDEVALLDRAITAEEVKLIHRDGLAGRRLTAPRPAPEKQPFVQDAGPPGIVSLEAEHYDGKVDRGGRGWEIQAKQGQSGTGCVVVPGKNVPSGEDYWTENAELSYSVRFAKAGRHYIWVRGIGPDGSADSIHVGLDGKGTASGRAVSVSMGGWRWGSKLYPQGDAAHLDVPAAGVHTVNVWMREDGLIFDKLVLTTSADYVPQDEGPAESPRGTAAAPSASAAAPAPAIAKAPPAPGAAGDVKIVSVGSRAPYAIGAAAVKAKYYTDRNYTITALPPELEGGVLVRTPCNDKGLTADEVLTLELSAPATVKVCYDSRAATPPTWLADGTWRLVPQVVGTSDVKMKVYSRDFPRGRVVLGGNLAGGVQGAGANYFVIVCPPGDEPAGWVSLFNGRNLEGWEKSGAGKASVEKGALVSEGGIDLFHAAKWTEFVLECEVRAEGGAGKSSMLGLGLGQWRKSRRYSRLQVSVKADGDLHVTCGRARLWRSGPGFVPRDWTRLRFEVARRALKVYRGGDFFGMVDTSRLPLVQGGFGFHSHAGGRASARDIRVKVLSVSLEGWRDIFNGSDFDGWRRSTGGKCEVENAEMLARDSGELFYPAEWEEFVVEFEMKCEPGAGVSRMLNMGLGHTDLGRGSGRVLAGFHTDGDMHVYVGGKTVWRSGSGLKLDDWTALRFELCRDTLKIFKDGRLLGTADISKAPPRKGGVYFASTGNTTVRVRKVRARDISGTR